MWICTLWNEWSYFDPAALPDNIEEALQVTTMNERTDFFLVSPKRLSPSQKTAAVVDARDPPRLTDRISSIVYILGCILMPCRANTILKTNIIDWYCYVIDFIRLTS